MESSEKSSGVLMKAGMKEARPLMVGVLSKRGLAKFGEKHAACSTQQQTNRHSAKIDTQQ